MKTTSTAARTATDPKGYAEGRKLGAASKGQKLPNFKAGPHGDRTRMFLLGAHHSSWEVVVTEHGGRLVPVLKPLFVVAGCNGTRGPGSGAPPGTQPSTADLEAKSKRAWGFEHVGEVEDYLYELDGAGHKGYFSCWERVRVYPDGAWDLTFDQAGYDAWRWDLVKDGDVAPPRQSVIAGLRRAAEKRLSRAGQRQDSPEARKSTERAERQRKALEEAVEALAREEDE